MYNDDSKEIKLDWMYKNPNSLVNREEYLLGRSVDKPLEQLNKDESENGASTGKKHCVDHECIPPSIRDFNSVVQSEQVDLTAKLQEDPLMAIKKREEQCRREFLTNPIQMRKLQEALAAREKDKQRQKTTKRKHSRSVGQTRQSENDLDIILMHKFNQLKGQLTEDDLRRVMTGCEDSAGRQKHESEDTISSGHSKSKRSSKEVEERNVKYSYSRDATSCSRRPHNKRSLSIDSDSAGTVHHHRNSRKTYSGGHRDSSHHYDKGKSTTRRPCDSSDRRRSCTSGSAAHPSTSHNVEKRSSYRSKPKLTAEEKEKYRQEMMTDAATRSQELSHRLKRHKDNEEKESKKQTYDPNFVHKQMTECVKYASVEQRIKSNLNNIQRSKLDMSRAFSRKSR